MDTAAWLVPSTTSIHTTVLGLQARIVLQFHEGLLGKGFSAIKGSFFNRDAGSGSGSHGQCDRGKDRRTSGQAVNRDSERVWVQSVHCGVISCFGMLPMGLIPGMAAPTEGRTRLVVGHTLLE